MNILLILAHPDKKSFNHAIANECKKVLIENGHTVIFHDLYDEGFDPIICTEEIPKDGKIPDLVNQHCDDLIISDGIIIVHPNWWGQPPAILKGWIDRIIRPGIAYNFIEGDEGEGVPVGLLKSKTGIVFNTSNTNEKREKEVFGDPLETIWKNCIFDLCGVKQFERKTFGIVVTSSLEQRQQWLRETREIIYRQFPIS
ncbi:MAG: NAD(P)H-dependent oxidoreductase [Prolixibacteraceae bacterium]|nr:NAD(P)H-dependent oxidoreductase [Prolixibacteraceae bacterium]